MTLNEAIKYLQGLDLENIEPGKYIVDDSFYYNIQEYTTKNWEDCKMEAHHDYCDIQWIIKGSERIDTINISEAQEKTEYNAEKDVLFYEIPEETCQSILTAGSYVVLPPSIAHRPGMAVDGVNAPVKKCVGKLLWK